MQGAAEQQQGQAEQVASEAAAADRQRLLKQGGIHLAAAFGAIAVWVSLDAWQLVTGLSVAAVLSVLAAVAAGVVLSHLAHEWSHFLGARLSGAASPVKDKPALLMFDYDYENNTPRQFMWTSIGGSLGNGVLVVLVALTIPIDSAGRAMLLASTVGMAMFVASFEWPVIAHFRRNGDVMAALTEGFGDIAGALRRSIRVAVAATLVVWLVLL